MGMGNNGTGGNWTADKVQTAAKLWLDGASASEISAALGYEFSRNAVIGKISRMKLDGKRKPKPRGAGARVPGNARKSIPVGARAKGQGNLGGLAFKIAKARKEAEVTGVVAGLDHVFAKAPREAEPLPVATEPFIPEDQRRTLLQLTDEVCRWPIGDPLEPGFHFCGAPVKELRPAWERQPAKSSTYCAHHHARAYSGIKAGASINPSAKVREHGFGGGAALKPRTGSLVQVA